MRLTDEEKRTLDGGRGEARRVAMEILAGMGKIFEAGRLVPVRSAHVLASLLNFHGAGLEVIERLAALGARYAVPTTVDPVSVSLEGDDIPLPPGLAERQRRICAAHAAMGVVPSWTCTPYWGGNLPGYGDHVAWSESSAVAFVNSVLGARTNRLSTGLEIAASIMGRIPECGLHLTENRRPRVRFRVEADPADELDFGAIGYLVGRLAPGRTPYLVGLPPHATWEQLTSLGAAAASAGGIALFHAEGVTAESRRGAVDLRGLRRAEEHLIDRAAIRRAVAELTTASRTPDLVALGCPHWSVRQLSRLAALLRGRRVRDSVRLWVYTSPYVKRAALEKGVAQAIEASGARILTGTCMVISFLRHAGVRVMMTDSVRAARLVPSEHGCEAVLAPLAECVSRATEAGAG
ncbi:MAG: aconitase X catalytic domain-containing protein [Acetobacteraceae bacterium]|nr:aconitase X catalytic domain-containing protein [Acetobacteraceae bacterium]